MSVAGGQTIRSTVEARLRAPSMMSASSTAEARSPFIFQLPATSGRRNRKAMGGYARGRGTGRASAGIESFVPPGRTIQWGGGQGPVPRHSDFGLAERVERDRRAIDRAAVSVRSLPLKGCTCRRDRRQVFGDIGDTFGDGVS